MRKKIRHRCPCSCCRLHPHGTVARAHRDINALLAILDERGRRLVIGYLALQQGRGAIRRLALITGLSRNTIRRGMRNRGQQLRVAPGQIRRQGGGRQRAEKKGKTSCRRWRVRCKTPSLATRCED